MPEFRDVKWLAGLPCECDKAEKNTTDRNFKCWPCRAVYWIEALANEDMRLPHDIDIEEGMETIARLLRENASMRGLLVDYHEALNLSNRAIDLTITQLKDHTNWGDTNDIRVHNLRSLASNVVQACRYALDNGPSKTIKWRLLGWKTISAPLGGPDV